MLSLPLDVRFEEHRCGFVVHRADEIDAVWSEPFRPILRDGLAGDFEIREDGGGNFDGRAGRFGSLRTFGDERRDDHLAEGEPFIAERACGQNVGRPMGNFMLDMIFKISFACAAVACLAGAEADQIQMDAIDGEGLGDGSRYIDDLRTILRIGRTEPVDRLSGGVDLEAVGLLHGLVEVVGSLHGVQAVDPCVNLDAVLSGGGDALFEGGLERLPWKEARGEIGGVGGGRVGEDGGDVVLL